MNTQSNFNLRSVGILAMLAACSILGGAAVQYWWNVNGVVKAQAPPQSGDIPAQIARLNMLVPSQSHTMTDVGYHWANLWFAGQKKNWPLAQFFFDEARQHIAWTVAIRPVRTLPNGKDLDIRPLFKAVDASALTSVQQALTNKNSEQFEVAYKAALESCYMCHEAVGKPYLRPMVPTEQPQSIINYDPNAKWPQ